MRHLGGLVLGLGLTGAGLVAVGVFAVYGPVPGALAFLLLSLAVGCAVISGAAPR